MQIQITRDGQTYGPYDLDTIKSLAREGRLDPEDLAWVPGEADWRPLSSIPEVKAIFAQVPPPLPAPPAVYHHVALWKFVLLSFLTLTLYDRYWAFRNWQFVRQRDGSSISPFWRAVFSPLWTFALAGDIAKSVPTPLSIPAIGIGICYFALNLAAKLPDPWWLVSLLNFVPLIPLVQVIHQINKKNGSEGATYARMGFWRWITVPFGALVILLGTAEPLGLVAPSGVVEGASLGRSNLRFLQSNGIIATNEVVDLFYSEGFLDIHDDGNVITADRAVSYYRDSETGDLVVDQCRLDQIKTVEVLPGEGFLGTTVVTVTWGKEEELVLILPVADDLAPRFIDTLKRHHRSPAAGDANREGRSR